MTSEDVNTATTSTTPNFVVNVGPMGNLKQVTLEPGRYTVQDILKHAELSVSRGYELRIGGEVVTPTTNVENGSTIYLLKAIAGN